MLTLELRNAITDFIASRMSLEELEDWITPLIPEYTQIPESDDAEIVATIEMGLAHISAGIGSVEDLRSELEERLPNAVLVNDEQPLSVASGSSNTTSHLIPTFSQTHVSSPTVHYGW